MISHFLPVALRKAKLVYNFAFLSAIGSISFILKYRALTVIFVLFLL